ncbi:DUF3572 domain-containing protein [Rhodobacter sp. Har01]|uniref:DUF3572 family protein n=1 Tax=Rhodobacter sp. Har01 TaxID=2883999 RepID=UPI001D0766EC|nr:DUF3572 family protein [Rhodobacter sp. Har01]MCB6178350.1 DUF3572 domain-containing protein [Rhodobacter sp. Har01]
MRQESAQTLALQALAFLAGQEAAFGAFLAATGTSAATIRARADDPDLLASVLDCVLSEDNLVLAFAREAGVPPEDVARARAVLAGGEVPNWT